MLTSFLRVIKFAFQGFWRNIWLSVINITILVLTLFVINFLIGFNLLADNAINLVNEKVDVNLYFKENVSSEKIEEIRQKILASEYIENTEFVSADDALNTFISKHESDEHIIEAVNELKEDNGQVFLSSLKIKAKDMDMYGDVLRELKESQYSALFEIDESEFKDYTNMTERISNISDKIKLFGYVVSIIFILIALMMVYNTIKIATYTHREEIGIMRLVGATNNFIKSPFIVEIIFYNLIAVIIVVILFYSFLSMMNPLLVKLFEGYPLNIMDYFNHNFIWIFGGQFIIMSLFSIISSSIAIKKFLKI
jgi:cell division transport system permease protein